MKRLGLFFIFLSLFPLYLVTLGITDAAAAGFMGSLGPACWILVVLTLGLFLGGICLFLFTKT